MQVLLVHRGVTSAQVASLLQHVNIFTHESAWDAIDTLRRQLAHAEAYTNLTREDRRDTPCPSN